MIHSELYNYGKKGELMQGVKHIFLMLVVVCFLAHFSMQESMNFHEKPRVNFYGTIIDHNGIHYEAENILFGGAYKQIIFYMPPPSQDVEPTHRVKIDLCAGLVLQVPYEGNKPIVKTFNRYDYIKVDVISNNETTKNSYVIPRSMKVYFDKIGEGCQAREHEVAFEEIDKIIIKGYHEREEKKVKHSSLYGGQKTAITI